MSTYDYKSGKTRIKEILDGSLEVIDQDSVPNDNDFTFTNSYYCWVTGLFVDIRKSTELFSNEDKKKVSKIIRSFTSEVIEILRNEDILREIGIRGDCVYAIYTTPLKTDISIIADNSYYINTFIKMLNKLLADKGFNTIDVGIGLSTAKELVIKAGRKDVGINSKVWIGKAVTLASKLSGKGNKEGNDSIVFSECTYSNIIDDLVKKSGEEARKWFTQKYDNELGTYYHANIIKTDFNDWINNGMKD